MDNQLDRAAYFRICWPNCDARPAYDSSRARRTAISLGSITRRGTPPSVSATPSFTAYGPAPREGLRSSDDFGRSSGRMTANASVRALAAVEQSPAVARRGPSHARTILCVVLSKQTKFPVPGCALCLSCGAGAVLLGRPAAAARNPALRSGSSTSFRPSVRAASVVGPFRAKAPPTRLPNASLEGACVALVREAKLGGILGEEEMRHR
jgi:hypothetical protein